MKEKNKILLSSKEVSKYLSISLRTLQKLSQAGKIKAIKVGRQWRYNRSDIEKYLSFGTDFSKEPIRIPNNYIERRAYSRINCSLSCYIKIVIPQKKEVYINTRILNISEGGLFLENCDNEKTFLDITNDDPVNLSFRLNEKNNLEIDGRVLRTQDNGIAVKFKKLNSYVRELIKEYVG